MKFYSKLRLVFGTTSAFGWFILNDIPYTAILMLIPFGVVYYFFTRKKRAGVILLEGATVAITAGLASYAVAVGLFEGNGAFSLVFLLLAVGVVAVGVPKTEMSRISGWWVVGFIVVFVLMFAATIPGMRLCASFPVIENWSDVVIFYLLAFIEPFGMGREYRGSPIVLGMLLIPFGIASFLALGEGAFSMAQYPYLSVWSGVDLSAFHHLEGIILCFYYGLAAFRVAYFFSEIKKIRCICIGDML